LEAEIMQNTKSGMWIAAIFQRVGIYGLFLVGIVLTAWAGFATLNYACFEATAVQTGPPLGCPTQLRGLEPLMVGLGFGIVGIVAWYTQQAITSTVFFLFSTIVMATGQLSAVQDPIGSRLFSLSLIWMSALIVHFHLTVFGRTLRPNEAKLIALLYGLSSLLTLPLIATWPLEALQAKPWFEGYRLSIRLNVALGLVLAVLFLSYNYRTLTSLLARQRLRLFLGGTILAFLPVLLFSLLPETFGSQTALPYEVTFPWLLLSPLGYVYAIFRYRLVRVERILNRAAGYYLLVILLLAIYLMTAIALPLLPLYQWPMANAVVSAALLLLILPLQRFLQHLTNWIWYGDSLHYMDVVERLSGMLALTLDRVTLRRLLVDELAEVLQLAGVAVWLKGQEDTLSLLGATGFNTKMFADQQLPTSGHLIRYLAAQPMPVSNDQVRRAMRGMPLQPIEQQVLALPNIVVWVALRSSGVLQGILLIGPWLGDKALSTEDERILTTLARQSAIAIHNVRLIEQVHASHRELTRAHQQLLTEREQTQQRLAQDLHDGPVQQIFGISYQIVGLQQRITNHMPTLPPDLNFMVDDLETIRHEILDVTMQLRQIIGDLTPPGLSELGLSDALEAYIQRLQRTSDLPLPKIILDLDQSGTTLDDSVATCLFRVAQESLRNAIKHAQAQHVTITLHLSADEVVLHVGDDGDGFHMPGRLSEFTQTNHFGLVGMTERVAWIGGQLSVHSQIGEGTMIIARIPLVEKRSDVYEIQSEGVPVLQ
jgi:signal transduction histidine kinase